MPDLASKRLYISVLVVISVLLSSWLAVFVPHAAVADTPQTGGPTNNNVQGQLVATPSNTTTNTTTTTTATATCTPQNPSEANTNIIFCGLVGSDTTSLTADLQAYLDGTKTDGKHSDVQTFLASKGLTDAMFTSGTWALGTTQKDSSNHGTLILQGQTVGTSVTVFSRCVVTNQFCPGSNGTITGSSTLFFGSRSTMPTLIHTTNGVVDFAIWTPCGNVITSTPPPTKPVQSLTCDSLTNMQISQSGNEFTYRFTANASQQNTSIDSYTFNFGDSTTAFTVQSHATTVTATHTYTQTSSAQTFTAQVFVNGNVTSDSCKTQVTLPAAQAAAAVVTTPATPAATVAAPTQLANTGPGDMVGIFAITATAGGLFHHFILRRKFN